MDTIDMSADERTQAIQSLRRKRGFRSDLAIYLVINVALWALWFATGGAEDQGYWPAWVSVAWGLGLAFNAWQAFGAKPISQSDIDAEMNRMKRS
ncbi:MAG TPA: 2TM domain-containing protein [Microthrixaceae bacterium]|nr:2TM domain-containing protein [Microthrixaceae bacterium]